MVKVIKLRCEYRENPVGIDLAAPRLSWKLEAGGRAVMQIAYRIQASKCKNFTDLVWDTGRIESEQSLHVKYEGSKLEPRTRYYYRISVWDNKGNASDWSEPAFWETGLMSVDAWKAEWITPDIPRDPKKSEPCPMLRKAFNIRSDVRNARIYATAHGLYELQLNGKRVGDQLLTPGWTSYNKRLQYQTYDVTGMLGKGDNALGILLGDGWFKGYMGWADTRNKFGDTAAVLLQLHITYADGTEEQFGTDGSWKSTTGPILMSEIYHGETYDARLEKDGWSKAGYDDSGWNGVRVLEQSKEMLISQEGLPVRVIEEIKPISIFTTPAGETVMDMGQNMVGWLRLSVKGEAGSRVVLKHAEVLDRDGNFYTENYRSAKAALDYTLKGNGVEVFEPHFTFFGFRYVKFVEFPGQPSLDNFTGLVIHSDMEKTGDFECSDEMINKLQHNILWGQKGNFVDVPTDCPQRDERLGWTGDAQVFVRTACYNMNTAPFFFKWLKDVAADQRKDGAIPYVVPNVLGEDASGSAAWGDAANICPWTIYQCFGDVKILEQQYDSMKAWVEYIRHQGSNEFLWNTGFHFGDWLGLDAKEGSYVGATAKDFIATAFYAYSTQLLVKAAQILGRKEDVEQYGELYNNVVKAFRQEFVTPSGRLSVPTQTAHVVALMFDLVEEKDRKRTADTLVSYLEESKYHLTTGFVGTPYLCHVLSQNGYNDAAYKLALQSDYPSWLYQIKKGATTIWEHWDGIKEDGTFWSKDMNSFNHYSYGAIGDWLYRVVAGIDTDENKPGYKHITIKPQPGEGLTYAKAEYESLYGSIVSAWKIEDGTMKVDITIPVNTTASVVLPGAKESSLTESGKAVTAAEGVSSVKNTDNNVELELGSGTYSFAYGIK